MWGVHQPITPADDQRATLNEQGNPETPIEQKLTLFELVEQKIRDIRRVDM